MKWGLIWLFGAVALTLSACGVTPYDVPVSLERPTATENIGNGTTVAVTIEDDRDDLILGNRNFDAKGASITSVNMLPALEEAVVANLEASGFQVVPSGQASDSQLLISLRKFNYALDYNLLHGWHTLEALLNADAKKASGKVSRSYRFDTKETQLFSPSEDELDLLVNSAVADLLGQLSSDRELLAFLAH